MDRRPRSPEEFGKLYERTRDRLAGQIFALTGDRQGSFDVVHEAFVRTWERWDRVAGYDDPEAYVRRVAFNLAKSQWRRVRRVVYGFAHAGATVPVDTDSRSDLVAALRTLARTEREAIVRHYVGDEPLGEIAREMGVPVGTVKSWLSRGRARLAERLAVEVREGATPLGPR